MEKRVRGGDKMFSVSDTMVLVALLGMESVSEVAARYVDLSQDLLDFLFILR